MSSQLHKDIYGDKWRRSRENRANGDNVSPTEGITYEDVKNDPKYANAWAPYSVRGYNEKVYDKISELLIAKFSELEPYIEGNGLESLQKTFRDGKLVKGRDELEMLIVYENDVDANVDDKGIEGTLLNWLSFADPEQMTLDIVPTVSNDDGDNPLGLNTPPDLILNVPDRGALNINNLLSTLKLDDIGIKDNVSQFMEIKKTKTNINRSKLKEYVDTEFSEIRPITFTQLLEEYNKIKEDIPFYRYRTEDFFNEYGNTTVDIPVTYRIEKFFEEFERIKGDIPRGSFDYGILNVIAKGTGLNESNENELIFQKNDGTEQLVSEMKHERGHNMMVFSPGNFVEGEWNGSFKYNENYDTADDLEYNAQRLIDDITNQNFVSEGDLIVITSYIQVGYTDSLIDILKTIGASDPQLSGEGGVDNTSYALIGWKGAGEGGGMETILNANATDSPAYAFKGWPENPPFIEWEYKTAAHLVSELQNLFIEEKIPFFSAEEIKGFVTTIDELREQNQILKLEIENLKATSDVLKQENVDVALANAGVNTWPVGSSPGGRKGGPVRKMKKGGKTKSNRTQPKPKNKVRGK